MFGVDTNSLESWEAVGRVNGKVERLGYIEVDDLFKTAHRALHHKNCRGRSGHRSRLIDFYDSLMNDAGHGDTRLFL